MTRQFGCTSLFLHVSQIFWREQIVVIDVNMEVQGPHHGGANVKSGFNVHVLSELDHGSLLQIHHLEHLLVQVPVALVVHFYQLLLESLLQCLYFLLMLPLQILYLAMIDFASLRLLRALLSIRFLLLLAQDLNVLNQRSHRVLLPILLGVGYALVHRVHQKCRILYLRFDDWPQLFN